MAIVTVTLEDQGIARPVVKAKRPHSVAHNRCQHEALRGTIVRQCRNRAVTTIDGTRLCWRHAQP